MGLDTPTTPHPLLSPDEFEQLGGKEVDMIHVEIGPDQRQYLGLYLAPMGMSEF